MSDSLTNKTINRDFSNVKETAKYLGKSESWVYKHQHELGVRKLGGSLFFRMKEELYERLFYKEKGVEIRLHQQGNPAHRCLVQNENKSQTGRSKKKSGGKKSHTKDSSRDNPNRHNLFDFGK